MAILLLGIAIAVFGLASVIDANRITTQLRLPGVFDLMGPDRYLMAVGVGLLLLATTLIFQGLRAVRVSRPKTVVVTESNASNVHLQLLCVLVLYAVLTPVVGYMFATFLFFIAAFRVMGVTTWRWSLISAVPATGSFILIFVVAADMNFPKGWFNIG